MPVHISPAKDEDGNFSDDTFHHLKDVTLKNLLAQIYNVAPVRIYLPPQLDNDKRYDIAPVLPTDESSERVHNGFIQAIQDYFGVTAAREERLSAAYVVMTVSGKLLEPLPRSDGRLVSGASSFSRVEIQVPEFASTPDDFFHGRKPVGRDNIRAISLEGTMDDFCHTLEYALDRPVVNETNLTGVYAFDVKAGEGSDNDFLERLRDQLNLNIIPGERRVQVVAIKPR